MGSTITTKRAAAAARTQKGRTLFVLFEESYSSNVTPHIPEWCCVGLGYLPAVMKRIFELASDCEGGMLRRRDGRLTPEGYIATWLEQLANPLVLHRTGTSLEAGDSFTSAIHVSKLDEAVAFLRDAGEPAQAAALRQDRLVRFDLVRDAEIVLGLQARIGIEPWRIVSAHAVAHRTGDRDPALGYDPVPGRAPSQDLPAALKLGTDVRLLRNVEGTWRCAGWQYSLVARHVRTLWQAELACPGHYRKQISAFRNALERAPPAPADLVVEIDGSKVTESYLVKNIEALRQQSGAGPGTFHIPVTADNTYALTSLQADCAKWLLAKPPHATCTEQVALTF